MLSGGSKGNIEKKKVKRVSDVIYLFVPEIRLYPSQSHGGKSLENCIY